MTYLPSNAIVAKAKLTQYLLVRLPKDDKSQYLAKGGYSLDNWQQLENDIREQILSQEATPTETTRFGQKYQIRGNLIGPNGVVLPVITVWMTTPQETKFVTLVPDQARRSRKES